MYKQVNTCVFALTLEKNNFRKSNIKLLNQVIDNADKTLKLGRTSDVYNRFL